jgi:hypothetical protein
MREWVKLEFYNLSMQASTFPRSLKIQKPKSQVFTEGAMVGIGSGRYVLYIAVQMYSIIQ